MASGSVSSPCPLSGVKEFKSSLCIIPPAEFWDPIQEIRRVHDSGFLRWPPHINLLYPFVPWRDAEAEALRVEALNEQGQRSVLLKNLPSSKGGKKAGPAVSLDELTALLEGECGVTPLSFQGFQGRGGGFVGSGFLELQEPGQVPLVIDACHGKEFMGRTLSVTTVLPKDPVPDEMEPAAIYLREALHSVAPFEMRLSRFSYFVHSPRSVTIFLVPECPPTWDDTPIQQLYQELQDAIPFCHEQHSEHGGKYTPHLSVGQVKGGKAEKRAQALIAEFEAAFPSAQDMVMRIEGVQLIARKDFDDPFSVKHQVLFQGAAKG